MTIRRKTRRRLLLLLLAFLLLLGLGAGAWFYRKHRIQEGARVAGTEGKAAARDEDYPRAMEELWKYLRHFKQDPEAWYLFGRACRHVPQPQAKHLGSALNAFQRALALRPGMIEARRELMEVFALVGYESETVDAADAVLAALPDDPQALRLRALALDHLGRGEEAAAAAAALVRATPGDLEAHLVRLGILSRGDGFDVAAREQFLAGLPEKDLPRPHRLLIEAFALLASGNGTEARDRLIDEKGGVAEVLTADLEDPPYVLQLVRLLDGLEVFWSSMHVLLSSPLSASDPVLRTTLVARLWQQGRADEVIERTEGLDPDDHETGIDLLAFRAQALVRAGREAEARPIAGALSARDWNEGALAWGAFLDRVLLDPSAGPQRSAEVCRELLLKVPANPYLHAAHGDACDRMGERVRAIEAFTAAARLAPSWVYPLLRITEIEQAAGASDRGRGAALVAARRAPRDLRVARAYIQAQLAMLGPGASPEAEALLEKVGKLREAAPDYLGIVPAEVELLAKTGHEEQAVEALRTVLEAPVPPGERMLIQLAGVCRRFKLGLGEECLRVAERAHGLSPAIALERAMALAGEGHAAAALAVLSDGLAAAAPEDRPRWAAAHAIRLEAAGDEAAGANWVRIADAWPEDLEIQRLTLGSRYAWRDREGISRAIERLRGLTGEEALAWRLARARWLLEAASVSGTQASEAVALLNKYLAESPGQLEARFLLANALERLGDRTKAIDTLHQALRLSPDAVGVRLELVRMLLAEKKVEEADRELTTALESESSATPDQLRMASTLLTRLGRPEESLALLERTGKGGGAGPMNLVVARLHAEKGEFEEAERVIRDALASPDTATLVFAAQLYAVQGRSEEAEQALARLDETGLDLAAREVLRARHHRRFGNAEEALRHYRAAAAADPSNADAWRGLLGVELLAGEAEKAGALLRLARGALPEDAGFEVLDRNWSLASAAVGDEILRPLAVVAVDDPSLWEVVKEVFDLVAGERAGDRTPQERAVRLGEIAREHATVESLQVVAIRKLLAVGYVNEAVAVAARTMKMIPDSPVAARSAAFALAMMGRWRPALEAAGKWRLRVPAQALNADLLIARAHLELASPDKAIEAIMPHWSVVAGEPDRHLEAYDLRVRALLAKKSDEEAIDLLRPNLGRSPAWRSLWTRLAARTVNDFALAERMLEEVAGSIPPDALVERAGLGTAWGELGARSGQVKHRARGVGILKEICSREDVPANVWFAYGVFMDNPQDADVALGAYRTALERDPEYTVARNNAAMIHLRRGEEKEALRLAEEAVAAEPENSEFIDTLAQIHEAAGRHAKARSSYRRALELQPVNLRWHANLARVCRESGDLGAAERWRAAGEDLILHGVPVTPKWRKMLKGD